MSNAAKKVVVKIVSDVECPWCWIGKRAIEAAAANINAEKPNSIELELQWLPFEIRPQIAQGETLRLVDRLLMGSNGPTVDGWLADPATYPLNVACTEGGLSGITFKLTAESVVFNTYRSHLLLTHAGVTLGDYTKQNALKEAMLRMTHGEGKNLDDLAELLAAAREAGVASTAEEVDKILADASVRATLEAELKESYETTDKAGVPHFSFPNGKTMLEGKSVPDFVAMLRENL